MHNTVYFLGLIHISHLLGFLPHALGLVRKEHIRGYRVLQFLLFSQISHVLASLYLASTNLSTILDEFFLMVSSCDYIRCMSVHVSSFLVSTVCPYIFNLVRFFFIVRVGLTLLPALYIPGQKPKDLNTFSTLFWNKNIS